MLEELRQRVFRANLALKEQGLVIHTWGNVSARDDKSGLIVIKPSGISYDEMKPGHMVILDPHGKIIEGDLKPSTDAPTHLYIYRSYNAVGGIVHTHSAFAAAWAQAGRDIPPFGTTHADHYHGPVPCTRKLSQDEIWNEYEVNTGKVIVERLGDTDPLSVPSVLVHSHGPFCWGRDAEEAVYNAAALEEIARMAFYTVLLGQNDPVGNDLLDKHFLRKHGKDSYYGQNKS